MPPNRTQQFLTVARLRWADSDRRQISSHDANDSPAANMPKAAPSAQQLETHDSVSSAYPTALPSNASNGSYVSTDQITTKPAFSSDSPTVCYIMRHADWRSLNTTTCKLIVPISTSNVTIPQQGCELVLVRRDSKILVQNYDVGGVSLIYCTAETFTWARGASGKRTLILYGETSELHQSAIDLGNLMANSTATDPDDATVNTCNLTANKISVKWQLSPERNILTFGDELAILMHWRNGAYNYWVTELPAPMSIANYSSLSKSTVIVKGGHLTRSAAIEGEILAGLATSTARPTSNSYTYKTTGQVKTILFNGEELATTDSPRGRLTAQLPFTLPNLTHPDSASLEWKYRLAPRNPGHLRRLSPDRLHQLHNHQPAGAAHADLALRQRPRLPRWLTHL
ncbi:Uu.00g113810.m01.CDS01 [Anthostomella pinea]|uniref:Uu.00g113810.m01.CDS01 n=1 Tax=Anthostomella pinea TaxID=933095 RepID=A0AAI8VFL2_9PEZI|nr:Uu.00g113810.m01.CDS01 [Anthostomella pinea]